MNTKHEWEEEIEKVAEYVGGEPADGFMSTTDIVKELKELISKILASERADWLRSEIEKLEGMKATDEDVEPRGGMCLEFADGYNEVLHRIITRYKEELKVLESK